METANLITFYLLAAIIAVSSILAITSKRMLRSVTFLFFALTGTAALYLMLNYHFLAAVQLSVYTGGILVLFIFAIFLTKPIMDNETETQSKKKIVLGLGTGLAGAAITLFVILKTSFTYIDNPTIQGDQEINMKIIGNTLMGSEKYQYLLPFEAVSILLLTCIIGGILIARKR